jgi:hypothetical protein
MAEDYYAVSCILRSLRAYYWVLSEILTTLQELTLRANGLLKFHASLARNRVSTMVNNLSEALRYAGISLDEKPKDEELYREAGSLAAESVKGLREVASSIKNNLDAGRNPDLSWLAPHLKKFAETAELAAGMLKIFSRILEEDKSHKIQKLGFALQSIVEDLNIIKQRHHQLVKMFGTSMA